MFLTFLAYAFLILIYAAFAWTDKVPASGFIVLLASLISHLAALHGTERAAKRATDAANLANPVPPPKSAIAPTVVTQSGFANPFLLLSIVIVILLAVSLTGCANMTPGQQSALNATMEVLDDTADIAVGAIVLDADLHEPDPHDYDAHRQWCEQNTGHTHCQ